LDFIQVELLLEPFANQAIHGKVQPMEWDAQLLEHLTRVATFPSMALIDAPTRRCDGTTTPVHAPLSAARLLRTDQGRSMLGAALHCTKTSASK
jgi:hypothetical protein